jgi:ribosome-binding protein aMBF1 (putative translation factor)
MARDFLRWDVMMAPKRDTSALGPFADDLRAYRKQAGLSREELGAKLNHSASLIAIIEKAVDQWKE